MISHNGKVTRLELPWPDKALSPNARVHWARKATEVKRARWTANLLMREAMGRPPGWERVAVDFVFHPPDKRRRDMDNLIASLKAANDGIADALGIDDSLFVSTYRMGEPVKGGAVRVEVRSA